MLESHLRHYSSVTILEYLLSGHSESLRNCYITLLYECRLIIVTVTEQNTLFICFTHNHIFKELLYNHYLRTRIFHWVPFPFL